MLNMKSTVKATISGRDYELSFQPDSPINDILEANSQINAFILGRVEQNKIAMAAQASKECPACPEMPPVVEPVTDEVKQG